MASNPTISIIIPVYRVEQYLRRCLDSVVAQSYTDWECICVDDGSPDGSGAILDEYAVRDGRFRVIHQTNAGVSAARNAALDVARGEWICFVDSDDWVGQDYLKHLVDAISDDVDYVVSGNESILDGAVVNRAVPSAAAMFSLDATGAEPMADLLRQHLLNGPYCKLYRKDVIRNYNIQFPLDFDLGEDLLFNYAYLDHVRRVATVPVADYFYRQVLGTSLSHKARPDRFNNDDKQWCVRRDFLVAHSMWTDRIRRYMYRQLWGIVYDGLFEPSVSGTYAYLRHVLSIPEIDDLEPYAADFGAARWIMWAILHRQTWIFWMVRKIK